jgi:hypothetical protein
MSDSNTVALKLTFLDSTASTEELQQIIRTIAAQLENQADTVSFAVPSNQSDGTVILKGEQSSSTLDIKINLDKLKSFGKWLYERLIGTSVEAEFEHEGTKFRYKGRNQEDSAAAIQDFQRFITAIEAAKQRNGK